MKKLSIVFVVIIFTSSLMAQEKTKQKEVGLVFNSFNQFGLTYKIGNEKSLWRFTTLLLNGQNMTNESDDHKSDQTAYGFGLKLGNELRKSITDKLEFRYGADLSFNYFSQKTENNYDAESGSDSYSERVMYVPGFNFVLGFNYIINSHLAIGAELLPYFSYNIGTQTYIVNEEEVKSDIKGFSYGLNSSSALISLMYRF